MKLRLYRAVQPPSTTMVWPVTEQERQWAVRAASEGVYPEERYRRNVLSAHAAVTDAIAAGDADGAGRLDASHLGHSQRYTLEGSQDQVVRATPLRNGLRDLSRQ